MGRRGAPPTADCRPLERNPPTNYQWPPPPNPNTAAAAAADAATTTTQVYREAVAQLVNIEFVGVAEQMDASAELLTCMLGVQSLRRAEGPAVPRRNVGMYAPIDEEEPRVLRRIEHALALDMRTYEYAAAMLRHRLDVLPYMRAHFQFC